MIDIPGNGIVYFQVKGIHPGRSFEATTAFDYFFAVDYMHLGQGLKKSAINSQKLEVDQDRFDFGQIGRRKLRQ